MSEQIGDMHSPVRDDAVKRQDEAEAREYVAEWPEPGAPPDDEAEREAVWAPAARLAGSTTPADWEAVELRSDLARHLDRTDWPLTRERLLEILTGRYAGERLLGLAGSLPDGRRYENLGELARALGLSPEQHG